MKDDRLYLLHIIECLDRIAQYTADGEAAFYADTKTHDAVLRNLQTLAESTQHLSGTLKQTRPNVDWRGIAAFRNVAVHGYLGIDLKQVWAIIERDLPELKTEIEAILKALDQAR